MEEQTFLDYKEAKTLADKHGTPVLVMSRTRIIENYQRLQASLPSVKLYYAVKSNSHIEILKTLAEEGAFFDIASKGEIKKVFEANVKAERILHSHPLKKIDEISFAVKNDISWFVFDNEYEIPKLKPFKDRINLLLRICISNPDCLINLSYKFGAEIEDAERLIKLAHAEGLNIRGISFHVGSQNVNPFKYVEGIIYARELFNQMAAEGIVMDTLDIGGGFPISYVNQVMPISHFCQPINESLEKYFHNSNIIAEPGRYICGDAVTLITQIISKSIRSNIQWYYIDDGVYNSFSGKIYDACDYNIIGKESDEVEQCIIAGPTCDSFDVLYKDRALPKMDIGDILIVPGMGAYTSSSASEFNGFERTKLIVID